MHGQQLVGAKIDNEALQVSAGGVMYTLMFTYGLVRTELLRLEGCVP